MDTFTTVVGHLRQEIKSGFTSRVSDVNKGDLHELENLKQNICMKGHKEVSCKNLILHFFHFNKSNIITIVIKVFK